MSSSLYPGERLLAELIETFVQHRTLDLVDRSLKSARVGA